MLLAGFGLLSLVHQDLQALGEEIVRHFHLNPASHYPQIFLQLLAHLTDTQRWVMAGYAFAYACLRLLEAYGLWKIRRWAEWLAVISGSLYIPIEVYELSLGFSWIKAATLSLNLAIVLYLGRALRARQITRPCIVPVGIKSTAQILPLPDQPAMDMTRVSAGKLRAIGYDGPSRTLRVQLDDGSTWEYNGIGPELWRRFQNSGAQWSFYRDNIEEEFTPRRVSSQPATGRNPLDDLFKS